MFSFNRSRGYVRRLRRLHRGKSINEPEDFAPDLIVRSSLVTDFRSYLRNLRNLWISYRLPFLANSSFGLNVGMVGRFATRRPISIAKSASWIMPWKFHSSLYSSEG